MVDELCFSAVFRARSIHKTSVEVSLDRGRMNRLKPQGLTITRCYMEGMWRDALSMTSFTKM